MTYSLLSISALCEIAAISRETLFREIAAGRLPALKVGRRTLLRAVDFLEWVEQSQSRKGFSGSAFLKPEVTRLLSAGLNKEHGRVAWTVSEFAQLTSLSCETIRREIKAGRLEGVVVRRHHTLIPAAAGYSWIKNLGARKAGKVA